MLIVRVLFWKTMAARVAALARSEDVINAYGCGKHARRLQQLPRWVAHPDIPLFRQRRQQMHAMVERIREVDVMSARYVRVQRTAQKCGFTR